MYYPMIPVLVPRCAVELRRRNTRVPPHRERAVRTGSRVHAPMPTAANCSMAPCVATPDTSTARLWRAASAQLCGRAGVTGSLRSWQLDAFFDAVLVISLPSRRSERTDGLLASLRRHHAGRTVSLFYYRFSPSRATALAFTSYASRPAKVVGPELFSVRKLP